MPGLPVYKCQRLQPKFRRKLDMIPMPVFPVSVGDIVSNGLKTDYPLEYNEAKHQHWVNQRMSFRRELDNLGDLTKWINSKPTVTELEMLVVEREKKSQKIPLPVTACVHPSGWAINVPCGNGVRVRSLHHKLKEVKWNTCTHERQPSKIIKKLDTHGTERIGRNALQAVFDKANMTENGELDFALELDKRDYRAIERIMKDREHQDLRPTARSPMWSLDPKQSYRRHGAQLLFRPRSEYLQTAQSVENRLEMTLTQQQDTGRTMQEGIQHEEVDVMRTECTGVPVQYAHTQPSSLGGQTAQMVHRFRKLTLEEYLGSMDKCHREKVTVSQATLERALLHPGDHALGALEGSVLRQKGSNSMPRFGGHLLVLEEQATPQNVGKETNMREPPRSRADPNAFWPGKENHVRLYLPRVGLPPEGVLFEHIVRTPVLSPGHWPINDKGYSTSGDIDGQKTYIL
ncbi:hypothetical protein UPYG_G00169300 [Umbra pygmaea]|uniref:Uncharacterized protein n=1 Tax=Umbra pygmaea TaxID=75934 RepID=A0ABD0WSX0_UMBPY